MANNCKICYNPLGMYKHNRQSYCSDSCRKIGKDAHNRVNAQNRVYINIITGRKCSRCLKTVHEKGMRKLCLACRNETADGICVDCGKSFSRAKAKVCMPCEQKARGTTRKRAKTPRVKKEVKPVVTEKPSGINPFYLYRNYSD